MPRIPWRKHINGKNLKIFYDLYDVCVSRCVQNTELGWRSEETPQGRSYPRARLRQSLLLCATSQTSLPGFCRLPCLGFPLTSPQKLQGRRRYPLVLYGLPGDPNSGPCIYVASDLPTVSGPSPLAHQWHTNKFCYLAQCVLLVKTDSMKLHILYFLSVDKCCPNQSQCDACMFCFYIK